MKCEECRVLVEEYFDRELNQPTSRAVAAHIENCASCGAALEQLSSEQRLYQSYDRELHVSPAMWVDVRERLNQENDRRVLSILRRSQAEFSRLLSLRFSMATSVALILFAVAGTIAVMKYRNRQETSNDLALSSTSPARPEKQPPAEIDIARAPVENREEADRSDGSGITGKADKVRVASISRRALVVNGANPRPETPEQLVREAEKKYLSAIALLTRDAAQRNSLDSETRGKLNGAMAAIDRTIVATRKAVRRNPNDPLAVRFMLAAYNNKIDVLKEMASY